MSLDVYLTKPTATKTPSKIFVREGGRTVEISRERWDELHPGIEPVQIKATESNTIYNGNITHNLNDMAKQADLYKPLWRPEEIGITTANQLIQPLSEGLARLLSDPPKYSAFNPQNGWGSYESLIEFVTEYLDECKRNPTARVSVWR